MVAARRVTRRGPRLEKAHGALAHGEETGPVGLSFAAEN